MVWGSRAQTTSPPFRKAAPPRSSLGSPPKQSAKTSASKKGLVGMAASEKLLATVESTKGVRCALRVGGHVWTGERSESISVRSLKTGLVVSKVDLGRQFAWCMLAVGKEVWVGTQDGIIYAYSANSPTYPLRELRNHCGGVHCLIRSTVPNAIAFSGSNDFTSNAWTQEGKPVGLFAGHTGAVRCALSLGCTLFTGSDDHDIRCWDAEPNADSLRGSFGRGGLVPRHECLGTLSAHTSGVMSLATASGLLFSGARDGHILAWPMGPSDGQWAPLLAVTADPSQPKLCVQQLLVVGPHLWSGHSDGRNRVWLLPTAEDKRADGIELKLLHERLEKHNAGCQALVQVGTVQRRIFWSTALDGSTAVMMWQSECLDGPDQSERLAVALAELERASHRARVAEADLELAIEDADKQAKAAAAAVMSQMRAIVDRLCMEIRVMVNEAHESEAVHERASTLARELAAEKQARSTADAKVASLSKALADVSSAYDAERARAQRLDKELTAKSTTLRERNALLAHLEEASALQSALIERSEVVRARLTCELEVFCAELAAAEDAMRRERRRGAEAMRVEHGRVLALEAKVSGLEKRLGSTEARLESEVCETARLRKLALRLTAELAAAARSLCSGAVGQRVRELMQSGFDDYLARRIDVSELESRRNLVEAKAERENMGSAELDVAYAELAEAVSARPATAAGADAVEGRVNAALLAMTEATQHIPGAPKVLESID